MIWSNRWVQINPSSATQKDTRGCPLMLAEKMGFADEVSPEQGVGNLVRFLIFGATKKHEQGVSRCRA